MMGRGGMIMSMGLGVIIDLYVGFCGGFCRSGCLMKCYCWVLCVVFCGFGVWFYVNGCIVFAKGCRVLAMQ